MPVVRLKRCNFVNTNHLQYLWLISDYMSLMKKALVLLKSYTLIKRVELEVEEIKDHSITQSIPAISKLPSLYQLSVIQVYTSYQ